MTVAELVALLRDMPQDAEAYLLADSGCCVGGGTPLTVYDYEGKVYIDSTD